jgi:hypothetical protein
MITENYYKSHQALALGQKGFFGGAIGTTISTVASGALGTGVAALFVLGTGARGMAAIAASVLIPGSSLIQGAIRYPVHYCLDGKLDTTAKKVMGLVLEFLATTCVMWLGLIKHCESPFVGGLFFSGISLPISMIACTTLGLAFIGLNNAIHRIGDLFRKKALTH